METASGQENKRIRSVNYTLHEKQLLISIISKFKSVIENKKTDGVSLDEKNKAWEKIAQQFNSESPNLCHRSVDSLKKFYDNQKKLIRKKAAQNKKEIYLTGGGNVAKTIDEPADDLLLSIINNKTVYGLENCFDSDAITRATVAATHDFTEDIDAVEDDFVDGVSVTSSNLELMCEDNIEENLTPSTSNLTILNTNVVEDAAKDWRHYKGSDLRKPITSSLKRKQSKSSKLKANTSRRRPMSIVRTFTSSSLGEQYNNFLSKKMELVECHQKEHELRCELLQLEIEIKRKELASLLQ